MDSQLRGVVKRAFTACSFLLATQLLGFSPQGHDRSPPDRDKRRESNPPAHALPPGRAAAIERLRQRVPGLRVEHDPLLLTPKHIASTAGFLSGPNGEGRALPPARAHGRAENDPHRPILDFIDEHAAVFGHGADVVERARLRRESVTPHNGLRTAVWEQRVDDIPIDEAVLIGNVSARGELVSLSSQFLPEAERAAEVGTPNRAEVLRRPAISARQAIVNAAGDLSELLVLEDVRPLADGAAGAEQRQRFRAGALPDEARAELIWLPLTPYQLRLCWKVELTRSEGGERFQVLVDTLTGEVRVRRRLTLYLSEATYRVFTGDSPTPFSPGWPTPNTNQPPTVARSLVTLSAFDTNASPIGWISDGENETRGNNVDAHLDRNGDNVPDLPRPQGSPFRVFDPPLDLNQSPTASTDAAVVQLFYWCNWIHDRLYELGFTEAAGNFQKDNFGRGGAGDDAIQADAQDGSGLDNANFTPSLDGDPGRIQMYLWNGPTPFLDGDLDAEVILHEYTHGLSTRLVGGGAGITALQTAGMGEGWSDFYALSLLSHADDDVDATYPFGAYVVRELNGLEENYYFGIRRYPYSTDLNKNPLTFKDIDPFQVNPHTGVPLSPLIGFNPLNAGEVHSQGEVWCAMLWDARASMIHKYGYATGNELILQLVTDGMKLAPPNPSFTQARDAILLADQLDHEGLDYLDLWTAFAKRGLGFTSFSGDPTTTSGVHEAFDLPDPLVIKNQEPLVSSGPQGGPFAVPCRAYPLTNLSSQPLSWNAHVAEPWLSVSPASGLLQPGGSTNLQLCINESAAALPTGTFFDRLLISNLVTGVLQFRDAELTIMSFTSMPFLDDFESGELGPFWAVSGTGLHAVTVTSLNGPHAGQFHVTLDARDGIRSRNELTLGLDLAGYTNVVLRFWARSYGDEPDGPPPTPFIGQADFDGVAISEDGVSWYEVQQLRSLTSPYREVIVPLDAAIAQFGLHYNAQFRIRFNQVDDFQIPFDGIALDDISVNGDPARRILIAAPSVVREGDGLMPGSGLVKIGTLAPRDLIVQLSSSLPEKIQSPATVTIPAGSDHASFSLTVLDNTQLDGTSVATLRAEAAGYVPGLATVQVVDNERATLKVQLPPKAREGDGTLKKQGVIRTTSRPVRDVQVQLTSSLPGYLKVPGVVVLPAGDMSVSFDLVVGDDDRLDGAHEVTVTAHVENWTDGSDHMLILDNDAPALAVKLPPAVGENSGVRTNAGTVQLSGHWPADLIVELASSDPATLQVPASVLVRSNALEANFDLRPVDNARIDGRRMVTVTARAARFAGGSATMGIDDDETPPAPTQPLPHDHATNVNVVVNLAWNPGVGNILVNGGFETGDFTGWTQLNGGFGAWVINDGKIDPDGPEGPTPPLTGRFSALVTQIGGGTHYLLQEVFLPADALGATLDWSDRIRNNATHYAPGQAFRVEVRSTNNVVLAVAFETTPSLPLLNDWTRRSYDLSAFRGQTIRVAFVELDSIGYLNVGLDDVSVVLSEPSVSTTFDLYFGTNPTPGAAEFRGHLATATWTTPPLGLDTTYYWQVIPRRGQASARGPVWQFSTRGVGAIEHFEWGPIAPSQMLNQRFAATLTAKDDIGNTVRNFNGQVKLTAQSGTGTRSAVVVTELDIGNEDRVEFANASSNSVNLSGWKISVYDVFSWPAPLTTVTLPAGAICPPGVLFKLNDNGEAPGQFPNFNAGTNITWSIADFGNPIAVLVQDASGGLVDFVCAGNADPALITHPVPIPRTEWNGPPVAAALNVLTLSLQRLGNADHDDRSDWIAAPVSFGQRNGDLVFPFVPRPTLAFSPTLLTNFVTGVWTGYLTPQELGTHITLQAADTQGHVGVSSEFAVGAIDDLSVVANDAPAVVQVGQLLTYTVLVANSGPSRATGVVLTNRLAPGVEFVSVSTFDGVCSNLAGDVICQINPLFAGDTYRVSIQARPLQPGQLTNFAFVSRAEADGADSNNMGRTVTTATFPYLTTTNAFFAEGNFGTNYVSVPVRLSAPSSLPVSVSYASSNGTAIAGSDYLPVSGRLLFAPGVTNLPITVGILGDQLDEFLETFTVNLFDPTNAVLLISQARFRIRSDDFIPTVSIDDAAVTEGTEGTTTQAVLTVRMSAPSGLDVTVDYSTTDGTAAAPADYLTTFGTLTFPSGTTTQFIRVPVVGDRRYESNETFTVTLFNPVSLNLGRANATVTILDDDVGELDRFVWSPVSSPQTVEVPFSATITALNGLGLPATNFNGPLTIRGVADSRETAVGDGTNTWEFPLGTLYHDARTQVIYLPEELAGAGGINALALDVASPPGQTLSNWTIRLKPTSLRDEAAGWWETNGWITTYRNDEIVPAPGTHLFLFDRPFDYDGTNALLLDLSFDNATYTTNGVVYATRTAQPRSLVFQTDSAFGDPARWVGRTPPPLVRNLVPNVRLFVESPAAMSPTGLIQLTHGVWTGQIVIHQTGTNLLLRANDRAGHIATGNTFAVVANAGLLPPGGGMRLAGIRMQGAERVLRFPSVAGKTYRLERTTNLAQPRWEAVGPDRIGTGDDLEAIDSAATVAPTTFYRLRILP